MGAFPTAVITDFEHLIDRMPNHPKDRHVLAAAVAVNIRWIVTINLRDFPDGALRELGVLAISPDAFLGMLMDARPAEVIETLGAQLASRQPSTVLDQLQRHAPQFVERVRGQGDERATVNG